MPSGESLSSQYKNKYKYMHMNTIMQAEKAFKANKFAKLSTVITEAKKQTDYVANKITWSLDQDIFEILSQDYTYIFLKKCLFIDLMSEKIDIDTYDFNRYFPYANENDLKDYNIKCKKEEDILTLSGEEIEKFIADYISWEEVLIDFSFEENINEISVGEEKEIIITITNVEDLLSEILDDETKKVPDKEFFYEEKEKFLADKTPEKVHYLPNSKHELYYHYIIDGYSFHAPVRDETQFDYYWENEKYKMVTDMNDMFISAQKYEELVHDFQDTYGISSKTMNLINTLYEMRKSYFND